MTSGRSATRPVSSSGSARCSAPRCRAGPLWRGRTTCAGSTSTIPPARSSAPTLGTASELAAHYVVLPIRAAVGGQPVAAALSLNTATHPDYQRRGLFVRLAEATYEMARGAGRPPRRRRRQRQQHARIRQQARLPARRPLWTRCSLGMPAVAPGGRPAGRRWRREWTESDLAGACETPRSRYRVQGRRARRRARADRGARDPGRAAARGRPVAGPARRRRACDRSRSIAPRLWIGLSRAGAPPCACASTSRALSQVAAEPHLPAACSSRRTLDRATVEFQAIDFDAY